MKRFAAGLAMVAVFAAATGTDAQERRDAPAAWSGFWLPTPAYVPMGFGFPPPPLSAYPAP